MTSEPATAKSMSEFASVGPNAFVMPFSATRGVERPAPFVSLAAGAATMLRFDNGGSGGRAERRPFGRRPEHSGTRTESLRQEVLLDPIERVRRANDLAAGQLRVFLQIARVDRGDGHDHQLRRFCAL